MDDLEFWKSTVVFHLEAYLGNCDFGNRSEAATFVNSGKEESDVGNIAFYLSWNLLLFIGSVCVT